MKTQLLLLIRELQKLRISTRLIKEDTSFVSKPEDQKKEPDPPPSVVQVPTPAPPGFILPPILL